MQCKQVKRRATNEVVVGNIAIGGNNPIRLQSMTTTDTNDIEACVEQALRIAGRGGELVRLTAQGVREAKSLRLIRQTLNERGCTVPLVADIHFIANVADEAAKYVEKVRINPGNYVDPARTFKHLEYTDEEYANELLRIEERLKPFIDICRQHHTAVRIGVNHGSLSDRIMSRYGDTPEGIVESCMEFLRIFRKYDFNNVIISIKASNTVVMVESVLKLVTAMDKEDMHYPLHLGVTEAGEGEDGRLKSAVGIGALLTKGIGDTIRVSLSEEPEDEIPVAKALVDLIDDCTQLMCMGELSISYPSEDIKPLSDGSYCKIENNAIHLHVNETELERFQLKAAMACGSLLIERKANDLFITTDSDTLFSVTTPEELGGRLRSLADGILQAARIKFTKTEYISCPGCGRTLYNLRDTIARIKAATSHLVGVKIGIMGCIVNGPGEMADADYGYVGAGRGRISLYKKKECVEKNIPEAEAVERLLALINNDMNS